MGLNERQRLEGTKPHCTPPALSHSPQAPGLGLPCPLLSSLLPRFSPGLGGTHPGGLPFHGAQRGGPGCALSPN